jgi:hypothetical protein
MRKTLMTYSSHFFTGSRAFSTHIGAFSTVLHAHSSVPFALFSTAMTNICTYTAELLTEAPAHTHHLRGCRTDGSAFEIKLYAGTERLHMLFI